MPMRVIATMISQPSVWKRASIRPPRPSTTEPAPVRALAPRRGSSAPPSGPTISIAIDEGTRKRPATITLAPKP